MVSSRVGKRRAKEIKGKCFLSEKKVIGKKNALNS